MSRHSSTRVLTPIFEAAELWRERCLIEDGSLFETGPLWTRPHLKLAIALIDAAKPSGEGGWVDQFAEIFVGQDLIRQLIAEVLWVFYLFPIGTGTTKRENIAKLWAPPADAPLLRDAVLAGIGLPGQAYYRHGWREIHYLLEVAHFVKGFNRDTRTRLFRHAQDMARFLDELAIGQSRASRHTLLYLLFPDETEPLVSFRAKRAVLARHERSVPTSNDFQVDRALAQLRESLKNPEFELFTRPGRSPVARTWAVAADAAQIQAGTLNLPFPSPPSPGDTVYLVKPGTTQVLAWGKIDVADLTDEDPNHWPVKIERSGRPLPGGLSKPLGPDEEASPLDEPTRQRIERIIEGQTSHPHDVWPDEIEPPQNLVFYGPPGTGKTRQLLERQAAYETEGDDSQPQRRWAMVSFHASYGYEDFVEGFRPDGEGKLRIVPGLFKQICADARKDPGQRYALFIDEINRGNLTAILGELITLLDPDKRCVWAPDGSLRAGQELHLAYSHELFGVPKNLDLYASMNTADRSLVSFDLALRRRFRFVACPPVPELLANLTAPDGEPLELARLLRRLNERIAFLRDEDHVLGHSYFLGLKDWDELTRNLTLQVFPLLEELFHDDPESLQLVLGSELVPATPVDAASLFGRALDREPRRRHRFLTAAELRPTHLRNLIGP